MITARPCLPPYPCDHGVLGRPGCSGHRYPTTQRPCGGDGGIDALYIFYNDILLSEGSSPQEARSTAHFELFAIQAKRSAGFGETAIDKFRNSLSELFDFDYDLTDA